MAKKKEDPASLETGVQVVARLGFKVGDVLMSKFWDVPLRLLRIDADSLWMDRVREVEPGQWKSTFAHTMRYLPSDVTKREDVIVNG